MNAQADALKRLKHAITVETTKGPARFTLRQAWKQDRYKFDNLQVTSGKPEISTGHLPQIRGITRTRGVQQPSKLKIAEFDSPIPLHYVRLRAIMTRTRTTIAAVAQTAEQAPCKGKVAGSTPCQRHQFRETT